MLCISYLDMNRQLLRGRIDNGDFCEKNVKRDESKPVLQTMSETLHDWRILRHYQYDVGCLRSFKSVSKYPDDFDR